MMKREKDAEEKIERKKESTIEEICYEKNSKKSCRDRMRERGDNGWLKESEKTRTKYRNKCENGRKISKKEENLKLNVC